MRADRQPIRVTILTGFLGAGKTTLLNRLLADPAVTDTAVIVNEFGEVSIDHLLVESSSEEVIELADGCVCCTVRGELVDTLAELVDRLQTGQLKALSRVVIETTGLADPAPVLASLMGHPVLAELYALAGIVCVVDAAAGPDGLRGRPEAERQIAVADRIVLSKLDIAEPAQADATRRMIRQLNASAPIEPVERADRHFLLEAGLVDPSTGHADLARWLGTRLPADRHAHSGHSHGHADHSHGPSGRVRSFSIRHERMVAEAAVRDFLDLLVATSGDAILRMKAVVWSAEMPDRPLVLHGARRQLHPPARLGRWPEGVEPHSRFVLIGEGLDERLVRDLFAAVTGTPLPDVADRDALLHNPLSVPGARFG